MPSAEELPPRLAAVLTVLYLIFNAGYLSPSGPELVKVDLCDEALRLAGVLIDLLPADPEPVSLAAMMYFQDARRAARVDAEGVPLTLDEQDRARWEPAKVAKGLELLERSRSMGRPGPYGLKASISALHATAPRPELTDWSTIVRLYDALVRWEPTVVVRLNRAVAVAMADSPAAGLALVDDPELRLAAGRLSPVPGRRGRTCCGGSGDRRRRPPPTGWPGARPTTPPSAASSTVAWPRSARVGPGHGRVVPGRRPVGSGGRRAACTAQVVRMNSATTAANSGPRSSWRKWPPPAIVVWDRPRAPGMRSWR